MGPEPRIVLKGVNCDTLAMCAVCSCLGGDRMPPPHTPPRPPHGGTAGASHLGRVQTTDMGRGDARWHLRRGPRASAQPLPVHVFLESDQKPRPSNDARSPRRVARARPGSDLNPGRTTAVLFQPKRTPNIPQTPVFRPDLSACFEPFPLYKIREKGADSVC